MRTLLPLFSAISFFASVAAPTFAADTYVRGYTRSNGTYVAPHYRTAPDSTPLNNYSTKGNVNPYTGQMGTRNPDNFGSGNSFGSFGSGSSTYRNPYSSPSSGFSPYSNPYSSSSRPLSRGLYGDD